MTPPQSGLLESFPPTQQRLVMLAQESPSRGATPENFIHAAFLRAKSKKSYWLLKQPVLTSVLVL